MASLAIRLSEQDFRRVREHLRPEDGDCEEAAFLFTKPEPISRMTSLSVCDVHLIPPRGFASRSRFHLELRDETRAGLIKHAHDLGAGLIECHSHPGQRRASFSWSDLHGFDEFVSHVLWRLPGRAYAAIVFAADSIDALGWSCRQRGAVAVEAVTAGTERIVPTGRTLADWNSIYDHQPL